MQVFCFHLNSKSCTVIVSDVFPLGFWRGSIAIQYASYHFQNWSVPSPLRYENNAEKNLFQWKQKAYPIWKLERSDSNPVGWKHSISWPHFDVFSINFEHISHLVPTCLLSTLSRQILTGLINIYLLWAYKYSNPMKRKFFTHFWHSI